MLRVVIIGYGETASSLMLGVMKTRHKLVGIKRWEKSNPLLGFLKDTLWPDQLTTLIKANGIKEIQAESVNSPAFLREIRALKADVLLIGSWGEILKKNAIISPKIACINCHPSLLPKHRGPNPYASAIIYGETKTGITFHLVDEGIDTGAVLLQKEIPITQEDTGGSLRTKCAFAANDAVEELLDNLEGAKMLPVKQDEKIASYFPQLTEKDARINWQELPENIHNRIRGLNPWYTAYTKHKDQFLTIGKSQIVTLKNPVYEAGKIIYRKNNVLIVSTLEPDRAVQLNNVGVYGAYGLFPSLYINNNINIGDSLK